MNSFDLMLNKNKQILEAEVTDLIFTDFHDSFTLELCKLLKSQRINFSRSSMVKNLLIGMIMSIFYSDVAKRNFLSCGYLYNTNSDRVLFSVVSKKFDVAKMDIYAFVLSNEESGEFLKIDFNTHHALLAVLEENNIIEELLPNSDLPKVNLIEIYEGSSSVRFKTSLKFTTIQENVKSENFIKLEPTNIFNNLDFNNIQYTAILLHYFETIIDLFIKYQHKLEIDTSNDGVFQFFLGGLLSFRNNLCLSIYVENNYYENVPDKIDYIAVTPKNSHGKFFHAFGDPILLKLVNNDDELIGKFSDVDDNQGAEWLKTESTQFSVINVKKKIQIDGSIVFERTLNRIDFVPDRKISLGDQLLKSSLVGIERIFIQELSGLSESSSVRDLAARFYGKFMIQPDDGKTFMLIESVKSFKFGDYIFLVQNHRLSIIFSISEKPIEYNSLFDHVYSNLKRLDISGRLVFVFIGQRSKRQNANIPEMSLGDKDYFLKVYFNHRLPNPKHYFSFEEKSAPRSSTAFLKVLKAKFQQKNTNIPIERKQIPDIRFYGSMLTDEKINNDFYVDNFLYVVVQLADDHLDLKTSEQIWALLKSSIEYFTTILNPLSDSKKFGILIKNGDESRIIWKHIYLASVKEAIKNTADKKWVELDRNTFGQQKINDDRYEFTVFYRDKFDKARLRQISCRE